MIARRLPWLVFAGAMLPRVAALGYFGLPGPTYYYHLSDALLRRGTFADGPAPTTYMEPLYPAFVAGMRWLSRDQAVAVMLAQIALAGIAGVLLFRLTLHLTGSARAGLIAAAFFAFYPYLVRQSVTYQAMNLHVPLLVGATWLFVRIGGWRGAAACGVLFGFVLLTRASLLPIAACAAALLAFRGQRREAAAFVLSAAAVLGPWTARCLSVDGSLLPTRIGENLFVSTFPLADDYVPLYDVDLLLPLVPEIAPGVLTETPEVRNRTTDSRYLSLAVSQAVSDPWRVASMKARNFAYAFVPRLLPVHEKNPRSRAVIRDGRIVVEHLVARPWPWEVLHSIAATTLGVAALAGIALRWRRRKADALLLAVLASVILVNTVFFPTTRLLVPMLFVLMFYAGCAIDRAAGSIDRRRNPVRPVTAS